MQAQIKKLIILLLFIGTLAIGAGDYGDGGDFDIPDDFLLLGDEEEIVFYNWDTAFSYGGTDFNTVSIRASGQLEESYLGRMPINSGDPNSVLMTPGDIDSQWVWAQIDGDLVDINDSDPNIVIIGLPTKTPWNVMFADVNGYPLTDDPNDLTYYQPERAFGIGMDSIAGRTYADNLIEVYSLLWFDPNTLSTSVGWGGDHSMTGPNNLRISFGAGSSLDDGYQNSLGGKDSGNSLIDNIDNSFWGYKSGENVTQGGAVRDEAYVKGCSENMQFFGSNFVHTQNLDIPDGAILGGPVAVNPISGEVVIGYFLASGNHLITKVDSDLNVDEYHYVPDGGWPANGGVRAVIYTLDGLYLYAGESTDGKVYKFDVATGDEIWSITNVCFRSLQAGSDGDVYGQDSDETIRKFSGVDGSTLSSVFVDLPGSQNGYSSSLYYDEDDDRYYLGGNWVFDLARQSASIIACDGNEGNVDWYKDDDIEEIIKIGSFIYAVSEGGGTPDHSIYKFDSDLNLIDSNDVGGYNTLCLDWNGNIACTSNFVGSLNIYVVDTDLNHVGTFGYEGTTSFDSTQFRRIPFADVNDGARNTAIGSQALAGAVGAEPNEASAGGYKSMFTVEGGDKSTTWGAYGLGQIITGSRDVTYGPYAGWPITTQDDYYVIDNRRRSSIANMESKSIIVGKMADDPNDQWLNINVGELNLDFGRFDVNDVNVAGDLILDGFSEGSVLFADSSGVISENNANLSWDDTNKTLDVNHVDVNNVAVLKPDSAVFQPNTDSTTFFQILDADGGNPVFNVDSTNERVGIGTNAPSGVLEIKKVIANGDSWLTINNGTSDKLKISQWATNHINFETDTNLYYTVNSGAGNVIYKATKFQIEPSGAVATLRGWKATLNFETAGTGFGGFTFSPGEVTKVVIDVDGYLYLINPTHEDSDGGREQRINFIGSRSGGEETTLARIEASHDGAGADDKGKLILSVNDGDDGDTPTDVIEIDSSANTKIGDAGTTNYTKIEADGTIEFNGTATVWDDMRIVPGSFDRPGVSDPSYVAYDINGSGTITYLTEWAKNDLASFTVQLPHSYHQGEDILVHLHWTAGPNGAGENGATVGWKIVYSWTNLDGTFPNPSTADLSDACDGTDHKHQMTSNVTVTGSGKTISSMLICNIVRTDTGADDTWAGSGAGNIPMLLEVDFHFPLDTVGSRTSAAK